MAPSSGRPRIRLACAIIAVTTVIGGGLAAQDPRPLPGEFAAALDTKHDVRELYHRLDSG